MADFNLEVERMLHNVVDWMTDRSATQFDRTARSLNSSIVLPHPEESRFASNRAELARTVTTNANNSIRAFNRETLVAELSDTMRNAALQFTAIELSAAGLAGVLSVAVADITGVVGVGALAAGGLVFLPYRKRQVKTEMAQTVEQLTTRLCEDLQSAFDQHLLSVCSQVRDAASPYTVYVKSETKSLASSQERINTSLSKLQELSNVIDKF